MGVGRNEQQHQCRIIEKNKTCHIILLLLCAHVALFRAEQTTIEYIHLNISNGCQVDLFSAQLRLLPLPSE